MILTTERVRKAKEKFRGRKLREIYKPVGVSFIIMCLGDFGP
jgi:hypothetical protein